ncbi:MAG: amino acid transporter [Deltaproteobacteria bacterium CG11_big_fil_rev_8_21_14_0_20_47_16]|nr:MAG: amino acid transporter [Deltaproteobacteria bacterium CG11_big_fil_rev_8_21_14_0_20_47_16]
MKLSFILVTFVSIFTIVNPLGAIPTFLMHANDWTPEQMRRNAFRATSTMAAVLIFFALTGNLLFDLMNITMPAFRIAGGMILFSVAFSMTRGANQRRKLLKEEVADAEQREDIAIVPLAIPLLAGPGSIGTVILLMSQHPGFLTAGTVIFCILLVAGVTFLIFSNARYLLRILGASGVRVMTRLFGLLLAAISIQFIINGITSALPAISKGIDL